MEACLLESCRGCCWSRYDAEPEIGEENSASLMTSLDASRMYDLNKYIHVYVCMGPVYICIYIIIISKCILVFIYI